MKRWLLFILGVAVSVPAQAQLAAPVKNGDSTIVVTGNRSRESKVEMSDWRMAETPHVIVFSQGDETALRRTAHNLEKLHFLLSVLHGRVDQPDETIKIAVTMMVESPFFTGAASCACTGRLKATPRMKSNHRFICLKPRITSSIRICTKRLTEP